MFVPSLSWQTIVFSITWPNKRDFRTAVAVWIGVHGLGQLQDLAPVEVPRLVRINLLEHTLRTLPHLQNSTHKNDIRSMKLSHQKQR